MNLHVVQFGLGPIGLETLKMACRTPGVRVLGAVDVDPEKVGKSVGLLAGDRDIGGAVVPSIIQLAGQDDPAVPKVAIHATGSNLEKVWPQIRELLDHGFSVVSTCEELSYPYHRYPGLAGEIDSYARDRGLVVLGTGVNPGFIMDTLVICLTSVTNRISRIAVSRRVDVSRRRIPLQQKVGVGMSVAEFTELAEQHRIGHVGLEESVRLIAYGLNWELTGVENAIEPTISEESVEVALTALQPGQVNGLHQVSVGKTKDGKEIVLDLVMSVGADQSDEIAIFGDATHRLVIPGGIFGDTATAAIAVNCAKMVARSHRKGLLTMADLGLPRNIHMS